MSKFLVVAAPTGLTKSVMLKFEPTLGTKYFVLLYTAVLKFLLM